MKDFKQAAEETKKRLGVDLFFICDKKPGACRGWDKWEGCPVCMNDMCHHTSNPDHAKYKENIKSFDIVERGDGSIGYFEKEREVCGRVIDFSEVK